jgi:hypothetical protein
MTDGQYKEISELAGWRAVSELSTLFDKIMDLFKDESMPFDYNLNPFNEKNKELLKLKDKIENNFVDPSPEDLMNEVENESIPNSENAEKLDADRKRRLKLANKCNKLSLRR